MSYVGEVPFAALGALVPDNLTRASGAPHQVVAVGVAVVAWGLGLVEVAAAFDVGSYRESSCVALVAFAARDDPAEAAVFPSEAASCWHVLGAVGASTIEAADLRPVAWERCGCCHALIITARGTPRNQNGGIRTPFLKLFTGPKTTNSSQHTWVAVPTRLPSLPSVRRRNAQVNQAD